MLVAAGARPSSTARDSVARGTRGAAKEGAGATGAQPDSSPKAAVRHPCGSNLASQFSWGS